MATTGSRMASSVSVYDWYAGFNTWYQPTRLPREVETGSEQLTRVLIPDCSVPACVLLSTDGFDERVNAARTDARDRSSGRCWR